CSYDMVLAVDPKKPDVLYAGGVGLWRCDACTGTPTWTEVSDPVAANPGDPPAGIHLDQHALVFATGEKGPVEFQKVHLFEGYCDQASDSKSFDTDHPQAIASGV